LHLLDSRMKYARLLIFGILLVLLVGCGRPTDVPPTSPPPTPTPGTVLLQTDKDSYLAGEGEIQLVVQNTTGEPVYLPLCGPWVVYRQIGATQLAVWKMECEQDFIAYKLPAGRSVAGVISLSDPAAAPHYLNTQPGAHVAQVTVYADCAVGEPYQVETGSKYGELDDCAHREVFTSEPFQIEAGAEPSISPTPSPEQPNPPTATELPSTPTPVAAGLEPVGQIGGAVEAIAWNDGLVAAGVGPRLILFDPAGLTPIGQTELLPELAHDVALEGGRAYLALGTAGLLIVDLTDPAAPAIVGSFQPDGNVRNVVSAEPYVLLAAGPAGLWILDATDPANPTVVSHLETEQPATAVTVTPDRAYLLAGDKLIILDVSNPAAPTPLGEVEMTGGGRRILVSGSVAYVAAERDGVRLVDLSDVTAPAEMTVIQSENSAMALALVGKTLLAADYRAGLTLIDTTALTITGRLDTPGVAMGLAAQEGRVYLADYAGGIRQIDIQDPAAPQEDLPPYETLGWVNGVAVQDKLVAVAGTAGLGLVDVSDPAAPRQLFVQPGIPWVSEEVTLDGGRAYVVENTVGLRIFDLTSPPAEMGSYQVDRARAVVVQGQVAYLAHTKGLLALDVSAMPPTLLGSFVREWEAADALVTDQVIFVADTAGSVWALDISNPALPVETGRWERPAHGLTLGDQLLIAAAGPKGLRTAAIANPLQPIEMGRSLTGDARAVVVLDQIAFLADATSGIHIISLQDPAEPIELGVVGTAGTAVDIATDGELIYVADAAGGLLIYSWE